MMEKKSSKISMKSSSKKSRLKSSRSVVKLSESLKSKSQSLSGIVHECDPAMEVASGQVSRDFP